MHYSYLHSSKCKFKIPLIFISDSIPPRTSLPAVFVFRLILKSLIMLICIRASMSLLILSIVLSMRNSILCFLRYITMLTMMGTPINIIITCPLTVNILVSRQLKVIQVYMLIIEPKKMLTNQLQQGMKMKYQQDIVIPDVRQTIKMIQAHISE